MMVMDNRIMGMMEVAGSENIMNKKMKTDTSPTLLTDFPEEILKCIADYLPLPDYLSLRTVCRRFRLAVPAQWTPPNPVLLFWKKGERVCRLFCPSIHTGIYVKTCGFPITVPDKLLKARIRYSNRYSKDSWLFLSTQKRMLFWNPFKKEIFPLRGSSEPVYYYSFCFSSAPTSSDCSVCGIGRSTRGKGLIVSFFRPSLDNQWCHKQVPTEPVEGNYDCSIFHDNAFYFLNRSGHLVCVGATLDEVTCSTCNPTGWPQGNFILECNEELLAVVDRYSTFQIFKLNFSERTWVEVQSCGYHEVYLSELSSFASVATNAEQASTIHIPLHCSQRIPFCYHRKRKYHIFGSEENDLDDQEVYKPHGTWITPRWH